MYVIDTHNVRCLEPFFQSMTTLKSRGFWDRTGIISGNLVKRKHSHVTPIVCPSYKHGFFVKDGLFEGIWRIHHLSFIPRVAHLSPDREREGRALSVFSSLHYVQVERWTPLQKIPSKLEVAPLYANCGLDGWMDGWVIPLRLLRLLEHLAVLKTHLPLV